MLFGFSINEPARISPLPEKIFVSEVKTISACSREFIFKFEPIVSSTINGIFSFYAIFEIFLMFTHLSIGLLGSSIINADGFILLISNSISAQFSSVINLAP